MVLRVATKKDSSHWDRAVPSIQLALNCLHNDTLGDSPFHLMYGVTGRMGHDFMWTATTPLADLQAAVLGRSRLRHNYKMEIQEALVNLHSAAQDKLAKQARYYNKKHRPLEFNVGDIVLHRRNVLSNKAKQIVAGFESRFSEPCEIIEKIGTSTYRLRYVESGDEIKVTYDVVDLKLSKPSADGYFSSSEGSGDELDDDEIERMTKILVDYTPDTIRQLKGDPVELIPEVEVVTPATANIDIGGPPVQKKKKEKPIYTPILPDHSSDTTPLPNQPVGRRTRQQNKRRKEKAEKEAKEKAEQLNTIGG